MNLGVSRQILQNPPVKTVPFQRKFPFGVQIAGLIQSWYGRADVAPNVWVVLTSIIFDVIVARNNLADDLGD